MTNKTVTMPRVLAPCPFCGSNELRQLTDDGIHFTQCAKCEATGPTGFKRGEDDAIDWNTRAAPVVERQDPVAYATFDAMRKLAEDSCNELIRRAIEHKDQLDKLQASPPAPVAAVAAVLPDYRKPSFYYLRVGNTSLAVDLADEWNACLDKVKEMNQ